MQQSSNNTGKAAMVDITILPPFQRFIEYPNIQNLKIGDVPGLMRDHKRLAGASMALASF